MNEHLTEWTICRTTTTDRRNAKDYLKRIDEFGNVEQRIIKKQVRYLIGFTIPKEIIKIIKSYMMYSKDEYMKRVEEMNSRIHLNRVYISKSFYTDYLIHSVGDDFTRPFISALCDENDGYVESLVMYYTNNKDADFEYSCVFLIELYNHISIKDGMYFPIIKTKINTSSCMACEMSGMFDETDSDKLYTPKQILELIPTDYVNKIKTILKI